MIYAIQAESGGPIKFGTSGNPESRLRELQTGNPERLHLIAYAAVGAQNERLVHFHLQDCRLQGEWFSPTPKAMAIVDALRKQAVTEDHVLTSHIYEVDFPAIMWFRRYLGQYGTFPDEEEMMKARQAEGGEKPQQAVTMRPPETKARVRPFLII
jgi:hypothetical protein